MPIIRDLECQKCGHQWEAFLASSETPSPPCPACINAGDKGPADVIKLPSAFKIKTNKSRAVDLTYKIAEEDYGMTDMNDNMREGDIAAKIKPSPAPQLDARQQELAKGFWGGQPQSQKTMIDTQAVLQGARGAAQAAEAMGANPMKILHNGVKSGRQADPLRNVNVIAKG